MKLILINCYYTYRLKFSMLLTVFFFLLIFQVEKAYGHSRISAQENAEMEP